MGILLQIGEPTGRYRRSLRRYSSGHWNCEGSYHNAVTDIDEVSEEKAAKASGDSWPHDDERWPVRCEKCGYKFNGEDSWQRNDDLIFRLPDGQEFTTWGGCKDAPPGAMVRASWYDEFTELKDRESWLVVLPDHGTWISTQKASGGGGYWDVTGVPPAITVHPSIWHNSPTGWHGFIRDGELVNA